LATRNCRAYPLVEIRNSSFEDCELEEGAFDLVVSADAFHWIVPEVGYPKAAKALKDSGSVAFFWNVPVDPATDWSRAIDDVYQTVCPGSDNPDRAFTVEWLTGVVPKALETYGGFGGVTIRRYPRSLKLTSGQYLKMLRTRSTQAGFDEATRNRLFAGIRSVIERFGGEVLKPQLTVLFHARVKR
jgi:hypothetical protein